MMPSRMGILVLGMQRSGTSALSRLLSLLGCTLPGTLLVETPANPTGYWESGPVVQFNDIVLELAGTQWDDWAPVNPKLHETLIWPQLVARGREVLVEEFADSPLFVLKDPRNCKLARLWLEILEQEGVEPACVLPLRNPVDVAHSLANRDSFERTHAMLIWLCHVLSAEAATRGRVRVFTEYESLLTDWQSVIDSIAKRWGLVWPRTSVQSANEITEFICPDLRHHASKPDVFAQVPGMSPWVAQTYELLTGWACHGEREEDYPTLDAIAQTFYEASHTFAQPMLRAYLIEKRALQAESQLEAERNTLAQHHYIITCERDEQVECVRQLTETVKQHQAERISNDRALAEAQAMVGRLENRLTQRGEENQQIWAQLDSASTEINLLQADLLAANTAQDKLTERLDESEAWVFRLTGDLKAAEQMLDETRSELAAQREDATKAIATATEMQTRIDHLESHAHSISIQRNQSDHNLLQRQYEVVQLTRILQEQMGQSTQEMEWLRQVHLALTYTPFWWRILSRRQRRTRELMYVVKKGLFDPIHYLQLYPDVRAEGINPLWHYIRHGMPEGRRRI